MKDLNYYLDNALELPTDPEMLDKLMNGESIDFEEKPAVGITEDNAPEALPKAEEPKTEETKTEKVDESKAEDPKLADKEAKEATEPDGVAAQDGKHVLPFSVLKNTRERANALESKVAEMTAEIERLKSGKDANESTELLTEEELAALEDEGPVFAKLAKTVRMQQEMLTKLVAATTESAKAAKQDEAAKTADTVQAAIDANEALASWQSATEDDPDGSARWAHALKVDETLRGLPAWKDKPYAERFAAVQRRVQEDFGDAVTTQPDRQKSGGTPNPKPAATASKKGGSDGAPETLSDMPGGISPESGTNLDGLDATQLAAAYSKMSQDQILAMLARTA